MTTPLPIRDSKWREAYNPLRGLTYAKLLALLEAGERGDYPDLQWFYHHMERADPTIMSVVARRRAAILAWDWDIRTLKNADPILAEEQAVFLRDAYNRIDNLRATVAHLESAFFRGYAHLEMHTDDVGAPVHFEPVPQWFFRRDHQNAPWEYKADANIAGRGEPIDPQDWLIFEQIPTNRVIAPLFFRKALAAKNWDSYLEVFGIPSTFIIGPPNVSDETEEYKAIAEELLSNGRGFLPNGSSVAYVNGGTAKPPFEALCDYLDKQIVSAATCGLMTMLASEGAGFMPGAQQADTFRSLALADAGVIAELLQIQLDTPLLKKAFPGQPQAAYFDFITADPTTASQAVNTALLLSGLGYKIDSKELGAKLGIDLEGQTPVADMDPNTLASAMKKADLTTRLQQQNG